MNIYIDLDGTIHDTNKLHTNFIKLMNKYNIDINQIKEVKQEKAYQNTKSLDILAEELIKKYNLNYSILEDLNKIYEEDYLYEDIIPFLENHYKEYNLILLTLGHIPYQQKKINASKISKYFKEIIITDKDKSKLEIDYSKGLFIDNNPNELKKFHISNAKYLIRIKRENDKYSIIESTVDNIPEFTNFKDIGNHINKIGGFKHE